MVSQRYARLGALDQGRFGAPLPEPTTLLHVNFQKHFPNMASPEGLEDFQPPGYPHVWEVLLPDESGDQPVTPNPPAVCPCKELFVLHLFSGQRRQHDFQGFLEPLLNCHSP